MLLKPIFFDFINLRYIQRSWQLLTLTFKMTFRTPQPDHIARHQIFPGSVRIGAGLLLASLFIFFMIFVLDGPIALAARAFYSSHPAIAGIFEFITDFGTSSWLLIILSAIVVIISTLDWSTFDRSRRRTFLTIYENAGFLLFTIVFSGILTNLIKNAIGRARPKHIDEVGAVHFDFGAFNFIYASFPSGHSVTFACLCMGLALFWPRFWPVWLVVALVGGISRVMVLAHYPSDVIVGLILGSSFALFSARFLALRNVLFTFNGDKLIPQRLR